MEMFRGSWHEAEMPAPPLYTALLGIERGGPLVRLKELPETISLPTEIATYFGSMLSRAEKEGVEMSGYVDLGGRLLKIKAGNFRFNSDGRLAVRSWLLCPSFMYIHTHPKLEYDTGATPSPADLAFVLAHPRAAYAYGIAAPTSSCVIVHTRESFAMPLTVLDIYSRGSVKKLYRDIRESSHRMFQEAKDAGMNGDALLQKYHNEFLPWLNYRVARACAELDLGYYRYEGDIRNHKTASAAPVFYRY